MMIIETHIVEYSGGTTAVATGTDPETGEEVRFGGDYRAMLEVANAIDQYGPVDCYVEGWQVLGRASKGEN